MPQQYADSKDDYACKKCGGKVIRAKGEGAPFWKCTQGHGKIPWKSVIDQRERPKRPDSE